MIICFSFLFFFLSPWTLSCSFSFSHFIACCHHSRGGQIYIYKYIYVCVCVCVYIDRISTRAYSAWIPRLSCVVCLSFPFHEESRRRDVRTGRHAIIDCRIGQTFVRAKASNNGARAVSSTIYLYWTSLFYYSSQPILTFAISASSSVSFCKKKDEKCSSQAIDKLLWLFDIQVQDFQEFSSHFDSWADVHSTCSKCRRLGIVRCLACQITCSS